MTRGRTARRYRPAAPQVSREAIFAAYGGACAYCPAPAEHLDHITPVSRGGSDQRHNLLPACGPCNLSKSNLTLAEWAGTESS